MKRLMLSGKLPLFHRPNRLLQLFNLRVEQFGLLGVLCASI